MSLLMLGCARTPDVDGSGFSKLEVSISDKGQMRVSCQQQGQKTNVTKQCKDRT